MFNRLDGLYMDEQFILIDAIKKYQSRKHSAAEVERLNTKKEQKQQKRKIHPSLLKKGCFVNKTTLTSRATSNKSYSNFNADIPQWRKARSNEEEDIVKRNGRLKNNSENTNEGVKGISSEEENNKILQCSRKIHIVIINEKSSLYY